jgi:hypothetical protein
LPQTRNHFLLRQAAIFPQTRGTSHCVELKIENAKLKIKNEKLRVKNEPSGAT